MASLLRGPDHQSADLLRHAAQRRRDQSFKNAEDYPKPLGTGESSELELHPKRNRPENC